MTQLRLPLHSYRLRSQIASSARLVNCYASKNPPDAPNQFRLNRSEGIDDWSTIGTGPIWLTIKALNYVWVISGSELYRVDKNKTAVLIGNIGTVFDPQNLDIDTNINTVVVVNTPDAYYYDGTTFGQITDPDFTSRGAADVEFLDDFLLFRQPNSGIFFGAKVGTATDFDSLDFASAEGLPDALVGLKSDHRQAVLAGEDSMELWENIGGAGFPFARAINGFVELGCLNGRTLQKCDNSIFWLASDYTVRRLDGLTPVRVSQEGIEQIITSATISQARSWTYTREGHIFYVLNFPEATLVYDATTGEWHDRKSYGYDYWLAGCHVQAFGMDLVGHSLSNKIGSLSPSVYAEWGEIQRMEWTYQPVEGSGSLVFHNRLEIILETGVGLTTGQGSDPEIMMMVSDDGGKTFDSLPNRKLGAIGEYQTRVYWPQLGSAYRRIYRGAISDPISVSLVDTQIDAKGAKPFTRRAA